MAKRTPVRGTPLSLQVVEILVERIKDGTYPPETQVPPENYLADEFSVSRATVRKAMSMLAARGLIVQRHGVGTFVSRLSRIANPLNEAVEFNDLISKHGFTPGIEFLNISVVQPTAELARSLQLDPGDTVMQSQKIFTADGDPVIFCTNSIPTRLFPTGLIDEALRQPQITEPLYAFLEQRCKQRVEYHVASIQAITANMCDFPDVPLEDEAPLLLIEEVAYNNEEEALWHSMEYFPQKSQMTFDLIRFRNPAG